MRDFASQRHDPRRADPSIEGVHFACSRPCYAMRHCARHADRKRRRPAWHQSRSRCKTLLGWTAVARWQTSSGQKASTRQSGSGGSSSRSETWRQEQPVPRRRWSCVRSSLPSWLSIKACISLPLRRASICGHLRFGSVEPNHLRPDGRQGAYPALQCGHENGPAGHLAAAFSGLSDAFFGLAAKGNFGVARMAARPCIGRLCCPNDKQAIDAQLAYPWRGRRLRRSSGLRPQLRLWLRPSLRSCLHLAIGSRGLARPSQRALRAGRFADISTQPPGRNIKRNRGSLIVLSILSASLALAACAIASALAPQRFAGSTAPIALGATAIASALATHRLLASALASQRSGWRRPRAWRLA
jgi:hypothetical protein